MINITKIEKSSNKFPVLMKGNKTGKIMLFLSKNSAVVISNDDEYNPFGTFFENNAFITDYGPYNGKIILENS